MFAYVRNMAAVVVAAAIAGSGAAMAAHVEETATVIIAPEIQDLNSSPFMLTQSDGSTTLSVSVWQDYRGKVTGVGVLDTGPGDDVSFNLTGRAKQTKRSAGFKLKGTELKEDGQKRSRAKLKLNAVLVNFDVVDLETVDVSTLQLTDRDIISTATYRISVELKKLDGLDSLSGDVEIPGNSSIAFRPSTAEEIAEMETATGRRASFNRDYFTIVAPWGYTVGEGRLYVTGIDADLVLKARKFLLIAVDFHYNGHFSPDYGYIKTAICSIDGPLGSSHNSSASSAGGAAAPQALRMF